MREARGRGQEAVGVEQSPTPTASCLLNVGARALPRPNPKAVQYNVLLATGDWRLGTDRDWGQTGTGDSAKAATGGQ